MMKITFKNPFEVKADDTIGDAVVKGLAEGYIKGTIATGVGLGAFALLVKAVSKKEKNSKKKKVKEVTEEEVQEALSL